MTHKKNTPRRANSHHFSGEKNFFTTFFITPSYYNLISFCKVFQWRYGEKVKTDYNISMKLRTKSERDEILQSIFELYPTKLIELDFETPFQLITAVILSAQMTDKWVNKATKRLFEFVKTPADLLRLEPEEVEIMLRGVNYYRVKTRHLFQTAEKLVAEHQWHIPRTMEWIRTLPWVGVKTAKVVLSHLYDMPFIGVDTHIHRVMNRLGIVKTRTPDETDKKLEKLLSEDQKRSMHHAIVLFGRYICMAKKCKCSETPLAKWCGCEGCRKWIAKRTE